MLGIAMGPNDKCTPGARARLAFEVSAGIITGLTMPEHTRRWVLTSETWTHELECTDAAFKNEHPDGKSTFAKFRDEAYAYAQTLTDPRSLNWVRVDWLYF